MLRADPVQTQTPAHQRRTKLGNEPLQQPSSTAAATQTDAPTAASHASPAPAGDVAPPLIASIHSDASGHHALLGGAWDCVSVSSSACASDAWDLLSSAAGSTRASSACNSDDEHDDDAEGDAPPVGGAALLAMGASRPASPAHSALATPAASASSSGKVLQLKPATRTAATNTSATASSSSAKPARAAGAPHLPGVNRTLRRLHARCPAGVCPLLAQGQVSCAYCVALARAASANVARLGHVAPSVAVAVAGAAVRERAAASEEAAVEAAEGGRTKHRAPQAKSPTRGGVPHLHVPVNQLKRLNAARVK